MGEAQRQIIWGNKHVSNGVHSSEDLWYHHRTLSAVVICCSHEAFQGVATAAVKCEITKYSQRDLV